MSKKQEESEYGWIVVGNLLWFGMWMYIIFGLNHSGWWIMIPILFHFRKKTEEKDNE